MSRGRFSLFALAMLLLVCASSCNSCNPVDLSTKDVAPTGHRTSLKFKGGKDKWACWPIACFNPTGSAPVQIDQGSIIVGFDSRVVGDEKCGCEVWSSSIYRGEVIFDVSKFKNVVTASLLFDEAESQWVEGGNAGNGADSIGALHLRTNAIPFPPGTHGAAVGDFQAAGEAYVKPFPTVGEIANPKTPFPITIKKNGKTYDIDVTTLVREWISGARPNTGLLFGGRDESWPEHVNRANITTYRNFRLRILFNPKLNPGA